MQRTAGNRLFHVVVENDAAASKCIAALNRANAGRLTFLPLTQLKPQILSIEKERLVMDPSNPTTDKNGAIAPVAHPLVKMLGDFDPKFRPAMETVWGKTYIGKDEKAAEWVAKQFGAEAVTKDGDKVRLC